jgi:hypothetical protein
MVNESSTNPVGNRDAHSIPDELPTMTLAHAANFCGRRRPIRLETLQPFRVA